MRTLKVVKVRLYPNKEMEQVLISLCDYRRYCWNKALTLWNEMLENNQTPTGWIIAKELLLHKEDWQNQFSDRCLNLATIDLAIAWRKSIFKDGFGKPRFKSKKEPRQRFKIDDASIIDKSLCLKKPYGIKEHWSNIPFKTTQKLEGKFKQVCVFYENNKFWANLLFDVRASRKKRTYKKTAVDVNVGHYTYTEGKVNIFPDSLQRLYNRINHYYYLLYVKRRVNGKNAVNSNNYVKTINKLQRDCRKIDNIQKDIIHKFTTKLVNNYDEIVIEDVEPVKLQMRYAGSKNRHRNMFRYFRVQLVYKCDWYGKKLIIADKFYPSTQRCSHCGYVKKGCEKILLNGNKKHGTTHNQYVCYKCGMEKNRDVNAVLNLLELCK